MKRLSTFFAALLFTATAIFADLPFRNHRYDSFKALNVTSDNIVFIGNSITDMHCWPEAFVTSEGDYLPIVNRGNSGTYSTEQSDNLESYINGKPKKVFMMIGTNDIATSGGLNFSPEQVLAYVKGIVTRIHARSPQTKVYLYSILKNNTSNRVEATWLKTNELVKAFADATDKVTYIDLYDKLANVASGGTWSYDNLHLTAGAYQAWGETICQYLAEDEEYTVSCVYPENTLTLQNRGGLNNASHGMRATYFSCLPIKNNDVLVFGDSFVKNGEWQELLGNRNVKNRGTGWGNSGEISTTSGIVDATFATIDGVEKTAPKAMFLYTGTADACGSTDITTVKTNYKALVDKLAEKAPNAKIYLMAICPRNNASHNTRIAELNTYMQSIATGNISFVDTYSPFINEGTVNSTYVFSNDYIGGLAYIKIANLMKTALLADFPSDTYNVTSEADAATRYAQAGLRNQLTQVIARSLVATRGDEAGQYNATAMAAFDSKLTEANTLLEKSSITQDEVTAMVNSLNEILNGALSMPTYSTAENTVWYQLYTPIRGNKYLTATTAPTKGVVGTDKNNYATSMWMFVEREDEKGLDIINRHDNSYLSPAAEYNKQISTSTTQPENGWTLSYANTPGLYIISSGEVQLNQTTSDHGFKVFNWSKDTNKGSDRANDGGQYMVSLFEGEPDKLPETEEDATLYYFAANTKQPDGSYVNRYLYINANGALANATEYGTDDENYLWAVIEDNTDTYFLNKGTGKYLSFANKSLVAADAPYAFILKDDAVHTGVGAKSLYNATVSRYMVMEDSGASFNQYQQPVNDGNWCSDYILEAQENHEEVEEVVTFTFSRGAQTATVIAPEGLTATIETTAPKNNANTNDGLWNTGGELANSLEVLCTMTNTSNATEAEPIVYKLTVNGLPANQAFENVTYTSKAFTGGGGYQNHTETRHCNFKLLDNNDDEIASKVDESIMIANGEEKTISFDNNLTADENGILVLTLKIWKGTTNGGCFYGLTGITLTRASSATNPDDDNKEEGELPSTIAYTIDKTTGNLYNGANANQNWNSTWKSNATPQLQFSCGANNMNWEGNNVQMMTGTAGSSTYSLTAPAGYVITEYSFTFTNNNHETGLNLTMDNGTAYTTSKTAQTISANNLKVGSASFVLAGNNGNGVVLTNFTVKIKKDEVEAAKISTEENVYWYYITSAASNKNYCNGKVMYYDKDMGKIRFGDKAFNARYIWSFWEKDGKLAIKNYRGDYFGTAGAGTGGTTAFGVVDQPNYIYTISSAHGAYIIKDNAVELHAQESGQLIVRWGAEAGGASLWKFDEVDTSHSLAELTSTRVEQGKVTTGIGNTDQPIIRSTIRVSGLEGKVTFQGVKGAFAGTDKANVTNVKAYFATNSRELFVDPEQKMTWRDENGVQFGETTTLAADGTFTITGSKDMEPGDYYLWITYDIAENAKEGNTVDASITAYTIDGKEVAENNGNPRHSVTIFLSEGAVLMPMDKGSLYYRIPSITVTKDGKRLVTLTDDRKQHNSDLPSHCYLVAQYSEDNGKTWSDPVTVAGTAETGGDYGHGDASIVTNRDNGEIVGIMTSAGTYGHGFFAGTAAEPPRWKTITSKDGGLTWETPVDHTDDLFGANCSNPDTKTWQSGFSGSGAALQKRDGTLVSSFVNRAADNSQNFHFFMSKDGGKSWYVSGTSGTKAADEPKTLERNNGDLAISVRAGGYNYHNVTSDDGETWKYPSQTRFTTGISGNACDGEYMVWCSTVEGNQWDIALQTLPNSGSRENVSIALSTDEGETFGAPKTICPRGSAYSATVVLPDGTLGCYYEENGLFGGFTMRFVRFSLDWASNGTYKFTEENPFYPIKSTNTDIENVEFSHEKSTLIFDLQGRRVESPTKGIYIIKGKKVVIK